MVNYALTKAERRFRVWMYISAWMYAGSGLCFLFGGGLIVRSINMVSARVFPFLPLYPLPSDAPEGMFWAALSLSMMAMITYICRAAYLDVRHNGRLVPILLLSKFCSSMFYAAFFITFGHLAHLVGLFTDGPLFVVTLALWLPAAVGENRLDGAEEEIIAAIGDAMFPRGGAFEAGFADYREENMVDIRRMFAAEYGPAQWVSRLMVRLVDLSPVYLSFKFATLRRLPIEDRQRLLRRIEHSRFSFLRLMMVAVKFFVTASFFNREEVARAVGYVPVEAAE
jgi:hypothetical protein